jgi:hypothetical protein
MIELVATCGEIGIAASAVERGLPGVMNDTLPNCSGPGWNFRYNLLLAHSQLSGLLWNLLIDEWSANETGADDVRAHIMSCGFLGDDFTQADQSVFGGDVWSLKKRCLFGVDGTHINDAVNRQSKRGRRRH